MAGLIEAVRLRWCPGINTLQGQPAGGLHEWLNTANYAPVAGGSILSLVGIDKHNALKALAADVNRLACAGSETTKNVVAVHGLPKSAAWCLIKGYYAALFYGHVLLRIWGISPNYLRTVDLLTLRNVANAYGVIPPFKLQTGQFIFRLEPGTPAVGISSDKGSSGSHEAMWRLFQASVNELIQAVQTSTFLAQDINNIVQTLTAAQRLLTNGGAMPSWLSSMRNDVQYRQAEGVWFPYVGKTKSAALIDDVAQVRNGAITPEDLSKRGGSELERFWAGCLFVIGLGRGALEDLDKVCGARSSFKYGQFRFEQSLAPAA